MSLRLLDFDAFARMLLDELNVDLGDQIVTRDTHLAQDAGLDSVALVEALAIIEELGSDIDDQALESTHTFGDLYHLYTVGQVNQTSTVVILAST